MPTANESPTPPLLTFQGTPKCKTTDAYIEDFGALCA